MNIYRGLATSLAFGLLCGANLRADAPPGHYVADADTVKDTKTGLVWQRNLDTAASTGQTAAAYCEQLSIAGGGWRAPTLKELLTLVDPARYQPAIDTAAFPNTPTVPFRSTNMGSNGAINPTIAPLGVSMLDGAAVLAVDSAPVRCVR